MADRRNTSKRYMLLDSLRNERLKMEKAEYPSEGPSSASECETPKYRHIVLHSEDFSTIVHSGAFIDKTLLIKEFFSEPEDEDPDMKKVLITAPNCFGKSVNMDMLRRFFELEVDEEVNPKTCVKRNEAGKWTEDEEKTPTENFKLFKDNNLKIYQCQCNPKHTEQQISNGTCGSRQFFYEHCGKHPVIFVNFWGVKCGTRERLMNSLRGVLQDAFRQHKYLGKEAASDLEEDEREDFLNYADLDKIETISELMIKEGLARLVNYLHEQFYRKVIILIDEFDLPIFELIYSYKEMELEYIHEVIQFIGRMISSVMKGNKCVRGGLINACLLLATTLLSYANNIEVCPFLENHSFSEFYGFTKDEVDMLLEKPQFKGFDEQQILNYYNGYQVLGMDSKLYSVISFVNYLDNWCGERNEHNRKNDRTSDKKPHKPKRYWVNMFGGLTLKKLCANEEFRDKICPILSVGSVDKINLKEKLTPKDVFDLKSMTSQDCITCPSNEQVELFLLYMKDRGYFNVINKGKNSCELHIPTGEIQDEITMVFYNISYYKKKYKFTDKQITEYRSALCSLDGNNEESFQGFTNSIAQLFSGDILMPENQVEFKGPLLAFALCMRNVEVELCAEVPCQSKRRIRLDLLIYRKNDGTGIIAVVKWGSKETAYDGLKQIFDCEYYKAFEAYPITKHKIYLGLHFNESKIVTVCAIATGKDKIMEKWDDAKKEKLIEKSKESYIHILSSDTE